MGKKKIKELTRLLNRKLETLGVAPDTKLRKIGQKPSLTFKDGKVEQVLVPVYQLHNLKKQMVSKILEGGEHAARAFIAMDNQALQGALAPSSSDSPPLAPPAND